VVPEKGTSAGHGNLQRGNKRRRNDYASVHSVDRQISGLALGILVDWVTGFVWLALWLLMYRKPEEHPQCTPEELKYIQSDPILPAGKLPWAKLLNYTQTWTFAAGKFLIDPIWWFYLFWIPDYMQREHGLTLGKIGLPIFTIYLISDMGVLAADGFHRP